MTILSPSTCRPLGLSCCRIRFPHPPDAIIATSRAWSASVTSARTRLYFRICANNRSRESGRYWPYAAVGIVELSAQLLLDRDASALLEQVVARLSLEPDVQAVHWHADGAPKAELLPGVGLRAATGE